MKPVGEEGYVEPVVVNSARKRALEVEKRKRAQAAAEKAVEESGLKATDETKSKEQMERELEERAKVLTVESSEVLREFDVDEMRIVDGFEPGYEFG